jgi:hypothetical protein
MPITAAIRGLTLTLAGLGAAFIAVSEYRTLRMADALPAETSLARLQAQQPWGGLAGQELARRLYGAEGIDPRVAEAALAWQIARAPLNPWRWLDRAEFTLWAGQDWARVLWHLDAAIAVQPESRRLRWLAAQVAARAGNAFVAEEQLRRWLQGQPQGTASALRLASQWIQDPEPLLDRVLPPGDAYLEQTLSFAHRERRMDLAAAAWTRLPRPRPPGDQALLDFVDLALATGWRGDAAAAWAESYPEYAYGKVHNGDFLRDFGAERGLDWRRRMPPGTAVVRDTRVFHTAPASLRIDFDGRNNPGLSQPSLPVLVPPRFTDGRWTLSGYWRGEGLTTRSLPYLRLAADGVGEARLPVPARDFDWTPFQIEIDLPRDGTVLNLQVRRNAVSREFDRNIAGRLWIDDLRLTSP